MFPSLSDYPGRTLKATINSVICFGFRVYGSRQTQVINAWDFPKRWRKDVNDDYELIKFAHSILKGADAIVTYNGKKFDQRVLNTRFFVHGLPPIPHVTHIDLCQVAKRRLLSYSNSLKTIAPLISGQNKLEHEGWPLWVKVSQRDPKAMAKMTKYCAQDVSVLEPIFKKFLPFITDVPNYNLFGAYGGAVCPSCGSTRIRSNGWRITKTRKYRRMVCRDCGSASRLDTNGKDPRSL